MLVRAGVQTHTTMNTGVAILQEAENLSTPRSRYTTLGHMPKDYYRDTCSNVFTAAVLRRPRNRKQPTCLSMDGWTKKV